MRGQTVFVSILALINLVWLGITIFVLTKTPVIGIIMFIPILIGLITYFITKKIKKFETFKAFKYANIACCIPVGIVVLLLIVFGFGMTRTAGVVAIDPITQQCLQACRNITKEVTNATETCIQTCYQNMRG